MGCFLGNFSRLSVTLFRPHQGAAFLLSTTLALPLSQGQSQRPFYCTLPEPRDPLHAL